MPESQGENNGTASTGNTVAIWAVVVTGAVMVLITIWVIYLAFRSEGVGNFASIATLILVGLAAFIGIMNMLSLTANWVKMIDPKQPFGLPEGTVRAILTIAFIVLVGVLTSFMLSNGQRPTFNAKPMIIATSIPLPAATVLEQKFSAEGVVTVIKDILTATELQVAEKKIRDDREAAKNPVKPDEKIVVPDSYTVSFYPRADYRQSDEIAKQILTILSTILAAMIGFYFGAKPGESSSTPKTDDRAALLAHFNAAKTKEPTIKTVSGNINDVANKENASSASKEA